MCNLALAWLTESSTFAKLLNSCVLFEVSRGAAEKLGVSRGVKISALKPPWRGCAACCRRVPSLRSALKGEAKLTSSSSQGLRCKNFRFCSRQHCVSSERVVSNDVLRVRAIRTKFRRCSSSVASARRLLMPARETEAIILKTFPLGESDRVVSFLGRGSGRLRGVAPGARRLKNRFGSTLEILSHVHLWYVERETRDLVRIQQADLLESFHKTQSDYALSTGLAVISEIVELVLPEREVSEAMFRLILLAVREVERTGSWQLPLSYLAFWTVRLGGWLPRFDRCTTCQSALDAGPASCDKHHPGLYCDKCRQPGMKPLRREARELAEYFTGERLDRIAYDESMKPRAAELRSAALGWIEFHSERRLVTPELLETA
jgi:DNA repair protein RecO (recombination protein O)